MAISETKDARVLLDSVTYTVSVDAHMYIWNLTTQQSNTIPYIKLVPSCCVRLQITVSRPAAEAACQLMMLVLNYILLQQHMHFLAATDWQNPLNCIDLYLIAASFKWPICLPALFLWSYSSWCWDSKGTQWKLLWLDSLVLLQLL